MLLFLSLPFNDYVQENSNNDAGDDDDLQCLHVPVNFFVRFLTHTIITLCFNCSQEEPEE